jgi:acyl carrier protein
MTDIQETGTDLRRELRAYVEETFLYLHPGVELADDDEFLVLGIIDSLGFVELVDEVQARYGIAVQDVEITEENFGSLDALAAFVERKRAEAAA